MMSFITVTKTEACLGVGKTERDPVGSIPAVPNPMAGKKEIDEKPNFDYYPTVDGSGGRFADQ